MQYKNAIIQYKKNMMRSLRADRINQSRGQKSIIQLIGYSLGLVCLVCLIGHINEKPNQTVVFYVKLNRKLVRSNCHNTRHDNGVNYV
jgi:hypothetical protein